MAKSFLLSLTTDERRKVLLHEEDGRQWVETRQDLTPIEQRAAAMWCDNPPKDMRRVALIPKTVLDQAFNEGWFHDEAAWKRWANDPKNVKLRTCKGTI